MLPYENDEKSWTFYNHGSRKRLLLKGNYCLEGPIFHFHDYGMDLLGTFPRAKVPVSSTAMRTRSNSRSSLLNGSASGDSKDCDYSELRKRGMVITIDTPPQKQ